MTKKFQVIWTKFKEKLDNATTPAKVKKAYIIAIIVAAVLIVITTVFTIYLNDFYKADMDAISEAIGETDTVEVYELRDGVTVFRPMDSCDKGLIFYPGGKVECDSYAPLLCELAEQGVLCVLVEMPFNLAVLDVNAADKIFAEIPDVYEWYIGGHSLGGSMAASYLSSHTDRLSGLILLASYSTSDVSDSTVLSIYGSNDGVMNREKYEKYKSNLPTDFTEIIIDGGNHAYFGMYGEQDGDGEAEISALWQIELTAGYIVEFIGK